MTENLNNVDILSKIKQESTFKRKIRKRRLELLGHIKKKKEFGEFDRQRTLKASWTERNSE